MDRLMLGALADAGAVGIYAVVASLAIIGSLAHNSLVPIFLPIAASAHRRGQSQDLSAAYSVTATWAGYPSAILLIIFIGFGEWILSVFGKDYSTPEAHHVLVLLGAVIFLSSWVGPTGALLQMSGGHRLEFLNTVLFLAANFGLNLILIPRYGLLGAATATLASGLLRNLLQVGELYFLRGFVPISRRQVVILGPVLAIVSSVPFLGLSTLAIFISSLLGVLCLLFFFFMGLTLEEKSFLRSFKLKLAGVVLTD
jgi:O-antigen/teichoic acid export membrane protein